MMDYPVTLMPWPTDEHGTKIHWSELFKVHPAAVVFEPLPEHEMDALVENIKANGLQVPPMFWKSPDKNLYLIDGKNRLEAAMKADVELGWSRTPVGSGWWLDEAPVLDEEADPVSSIIGLNINRRHLTKQKQAELIVEATKAGATLEKSARVFSPIKGKKGGSTKNKIREMAFANCEAIGLSEATAKSAWDNAAKNDQLENNRSFQKPPTASATTTRQSSKKQTWSTTLNSSAPKQDRIAEIWELMAYLKIKHTDLV